MTLTASSTGPVSIGTPIVLTANGTSCGVGESPEYRFLIRRDGATGVFSELRSYAAAPQFQLDTSALAPGKYTVQAYSRAIGRTVAKDAYKSLNLLIGPTCNAVTLSATPGSPQLPGPTVSVSANPTCSEGALAEHRLLLKAPGSSTHTELSSWSSSPFSWPTAGLPAGPYSLLVYTRAAGNASSFEASRTLAYSLGAVCTQLQGTLSPAQVANPGTQVTLNALATCTNGAAADYQFSYRPGTSGAWQVIRGWGAASGTWDTGGLPTGPYQVLLGARASDYAGPIQVSKTLTYNLGGTCSSAVLSVNPKSPQPLGTALTLSATATCIGAPIEYRYFYRDALATTYSEIRPWSESATASFNTQNVLPGLGSSAMSVTASPCRRRQPRHSLPVPRSP